MRTPAIAKSFTVKLLGTFAVAACLTTLAFAQKQPAKKSAEKKPKKARTDTQPAKKKPVSKKKTPSAELAEWKKLDAERRAIGTELRELKVEFTIAARRRKLEIKKIFETKLARWNDILRPKMVDLALAKLQDDPDNEMAAQMAREITDFQKVANVTDGLLKAGKETGPVLRLAGLTQYRLNNFERAITLLEQARDKNANVNALFLDSAREQAKNWQRELELRKKQAAAKPQQQLPRVKVETEKGSFTIELFEEEAPNTVANFISLVEQKFYDGQRIYGDFLRPRTRRTVNYTKVPAVLIGDEDTKKDFDPKKVYGTLLPKYTIKSEVDAAEPRLHFRGSLSMVAASKDEGYSDFAILRQPMPSRNPDPGGFGGSTVFGYVKAGMDVVGKLEKGDKIVKMTVESKRKHAYKPKTSLDKEETPKPKSKDEPKSKDDKKPPKKDAGKKDAKAKPDKKETGKKPESKKKPEKKPSKKSGENSKGREN